MFERPPTVGVMKDIIGREINGRTKSQFFFSFVVPCLSEKHVAECCGDNSVSLMCHDSFVGIVLCHMIFCEGPLPFWTYLQSHLWSRLLEILAGHSEFGSAYFENRYMRRRGRNSKRVVIPTLCQHLNSISEKLMTSGSMYVKNGCPNIVNANTTLFFWWTPVHYVHVIRTCIRSVCFSRIQNHDFESGKWFRRRSCHLAKIGKAKHRTVVFWTQFAINAHVMWFHFLSVTWPCVCVTIISTASMVCVHVFCLQTWWTFAIMWGDDFTTTLFVGLVWATTQRWFADDFQHYTY